MFDDSLNPIESSDNGEIGTVTVVSPILDDVDTCGDLVGFVQAMMDMLDEAIEDIYAFIASLDSDPPTLEVHRHDNRVKTDTVSSKMPMMKPQHGGIIADLHLYDYIGCGHVIACIGCRKPILSLDFGQLKLHNNDVIDPSAKVLSGLLCVSGGLLCMCMRPFKEHELVVFLAPFSCHQHSLVP
jgi:hypothetical protein